MRVLQLAPVFGSAGGIETYSAWLSQSLVSRGHQTAIAAANLVPGRTTGYEVFHVPELARRRTRDPMPGRLRILELARSFEADCVLVHHMGDGQLLRVLRQSYPTIEFVHSFLCSGGKLFRRRDQICEHPVGLRCLFDWYAGPCGFAPSPLVAISSLRQARDYIEGLAAIDLIVVGSQFMKGYLTKEGLDGDRIEVVDMAMGLSPAAPVKSRTDQDVHIVYVGRAVYHKGIQYLIRALDYLGPSYRLTIVGDGWYLGSLKTLVEELELERRVTFLGLIQGSALREVLQTATVAVVPSIYPEASGLVVPEMRSYGVPVIVTDVGGLREWVSRYSAIHLADPADPVALATAIRRAVEESVEAPPPTIRPLPKQLPALLEAFMANIGRLSLESVR